MADAAHPREPPAPTPRAAPDPLVGTLVAGRYRVDALLGEGGMGQVYRAFHVAIEKAIALKILRQEHSTRHEIVSRFHQEAVSASRIKHPHVLDVFDFGQLDDGRFFLAMELLEGRDLADELVRDRTIDPRRAVCIALQVARALGAAHSRGVVHRDLKPENVFLQHTADGEYVKIVDFGIAQLRAGSPNVEPQAPARRRLTRTGMIFGTPEYMSPEQALGEAADGRADIYALGVLLYEMLSGAVPFVGETFMGVLTAHVTEPVPPLRAVHPTLEVSAALEALVMSLLEKDPARRPQSMSEVALELAATPEGAAIRSTAGYDEFDVALVPPQRGARVRAGAATLPRVSQRQGGDGSEPPAPRSDRSAVTRDLGAGRVGAPLAQADAALATPTPATTRSDAAISSPPGGRSSRMRTLGFITPWLVLGVTAAIWAGVRGRAPGPDQAPSAASVSLPSAMPSRGTAAPPASVVPAPVASTVSLSVRTEPPGALLLMNGAQVCDRTPCSVVARRHDLVDLEARRGPASGKARVLAQSDQGVDIPLVPAAPRPRPAQERLCERYSDELGIKITVPCP